MADLNPAVLFLAVPGICLLFAAWSAFEHWRFNRAMRKRLVPWTVGRRTALWAWDDEDADYEAYWDVVETRR